jgi:small subunit ribosomal protein S13
MRIAGVNIPDRKRLLISLTYIYGIGLALSKEILNSLSISHATRTYDLSSNEIIRLTNILKNYTIEGNLKSEYSRNIKILKEMQSYKGVRHFKKLPLRGQRTKTNARTRKGKGVPIAGKK